MNFTGGIILCAIAIAVLFFGRARGSEPLRIFRVWIVGQLYVMTAMSLGVFGVAVVIISWPS
jgi:ABC-type nickel/cobalt efflux system permease component RcnA